jgi:hypothetical protein
MRNRTMAQSLHKFTEQQAERFIHEQHQKYYELLRERLLAFGNNVAIELPSIAIVDSAFRTCGQYRRTENLCTYSLPYCVFDGTGYYTTIAHEVCHAFQYTINSVAAAHGNEFKWLIRECGLPNPEQEIYHSYPIGIVLQVSEELKALRGGTSNTISFLRKRRSLSDMRKDKRG